MQHTAEDNNVLEDLSAEALRGIRGRRVIPLDKGHEHTISIISTGLFSGEGKSDGDGGETQKDQEKSKLYGNVVHPGKRWGEALYGWVTTQVVQKPKT